MRGKTAQEITVLCVGDLVGEPGCQMLAKHIANLKKQYQADLVVINGENASKVGRGVTAENMAFFKELGVGVVTSGNHVFDNAKILAYMAQYQDLLRPANYPSTCPGVGMALVPIGDIEVGVVSLQGRVFFKELLDCPFRTIQSLLTFLKTRTPIVVIDFHAEASAEKLGMVNYLDGQVSAVVGTHVHVQTSDERIFPGGTAFISDLGMVGSWFSMIGFKKESALGMMLTQMPHRFEVSYDGPFVLNGAAITIDKSSGKATNIERIQIIDNDLVVVK